MKKCARFSFEISRLLSRRKQIVKTDEDPGKTCSKISYLVPSSPKQPKVLEWWLVHERNPREKGERRQVPASSIPSSWPLINRYVGPKPSPPSFDHRAKLLRCRGRKKNLSERYSFWFEIIRRERERERWIYSTFFFHLYPRERGPNYVIQQDLFVFLSFFKLSS